MMSLDIEQNFKRIIFIFLLIALHSCTANTMSHAYVKKSIEEMIKKDQAARYPLNFDAMRKVDEENAPEVKRIIDQYGVPQKTNVGEKPAHSFITLVLHLGDLTYKEKVLVQLKGYAHGGIIELKEHACLYDRVAVSAGKKQKWGTQGNCTEQGVWGVRRG